MDIGIGLPSTIPGTEPSVVLDWARQADERGFASLGTLDRLVYSNYEPLVTLAAAGAVTGRIRLTTAVLLAPLRANSALFAKQAASIDRLSGGRLVLGMGVGNRADDFEASGIDAHTRGKRFDALLEDVTRVWSGEPRGFAGAIGPSPTRPAGPPLLFGGLSDAALRRTVRYGAGWIGGGGGPQLFAQMADRVKQAWTAARREGVPRLAGITYYALGPDAAARARAYLLDYYAVTGPYAERVASSANVTPDLVRETMQQFQAAGCDELIFFPCDPSVDQVDRLSEVVA
jgi:alkanesulfonate monooxygenase SsuD/methylene tetrahydromethanopterin reductase-like flavin-dependent oxidoreductase (luciferase family)